MNKRLADKFFLNQTTPEETQDVLDWFETEEGVEYLEERLDVDAGLMDRKELKDLVPDLDSDRLYQSIRSEIRSKPGIFSLHRTDWVGYAVKIAATFLVIATASFFTLNYERNLADLQSVEQQPIVFQTLDEENRNIVLVDGTNISMNSNSRIVIASDYLKGKREITLVGEAYFDVARNPDQPFVIHANQSTVEVLGTAFNVRSNPGQDNVQVAVVEGKVSFQNRSGNSAVEDLSVTLSKGQYGYLDLNQRTLLVDDLAVENYLAWMDGRFVFDGLTLQQVCTQLDRIYDIECSFEKSSISELKLTSTFTNESPEKSFDVIALSLGVEYSVESGRVHWYAAE